MNDKDRMILAEAMGLACLGCGVMDTKFGKEFMVEVGCPIHDSKAFNPFADANDDYAVLEWMRDNRTPKDECVDLWLAKAIWRYEIGDYARAALKVIE